ncbi:serine/threonine protein kinase with Chase2 sensor [Acidovorax delafieldii 2AN]|uniref:non-specific serine/threonine protein kinase n=1 Tax=Acidovorax delafieldii 2AN TaxID=573060 RepID=C5T593_ACIDE|nr:serine/threonine-protein kinase [Acidovorax delafieldii]EER60356.1 serine/threonine protein kinase with Chase2 sensor [Acidovorax delafieldii 2AN]
MGRPSSARRLFGWRAEGIYCTLVVAALAALYGTTDFAHGPGRRLYDAAVSATTAPTLPEIALIAIDEASLAQLGGWPLPRDTYARLIDLLASAGAKTVVLTTPFFEPQTDRGLSYLRKVRDSLAALPADSAATADIARTIAEGEIALDTDSRLAASMQRAGNVLLLSTYADAGSSTPAPSYAQRSMLAGAGNFAAPAGTARYPIPTLSQAAAGLGHLQPHLDADGTVRQLPLLLRQGGDAAASLALLTTLRSLRMGMGSLALDHAPPALQAGTLRWPTGEESFVRPLFPAAGNGSSPSTLSFADVLAGKAATAQLRDKIVLIGTTAPGLAPEWPVPGGQTLAPVEVLAHLVSGIRQGRMVAEPSWSMYATGAAALAVALYCALCAPRLRTSRVTCIGAVGAVALVGTEWGTLRYMQQWVPLVPAALLLAAGTAAILALRLFKSVSGEPSADQATAESHRMMALALHGQGQLDMAFDRLRRIPPSDALMDNLYHLAQDFERKHDFAKAQAAYERILRHDRLYKDVRARYKRARALAQAEPASMVSPPPPPVSVPAEATLTTRPMLGRYQIDKEIGKGSMGLVYRGLDPKIGRVVAIKTLALSQEFEGEALVDARARFFREAETAGRLQHPSIVTIFDAGEDQELAYIAMEFLKGADLTQAGQPMHLLPVEQVLSIMARVADALDYAHAHQVIHRDIKPANIMYDATSDTVKVTDFGIARITDSSKTRTGLVLGTPSFMSPEQLAGKKVDGRSDLYSLGVTLYQLLTGVLPLRGDSMTELMHRIANMEPPDVRQQRAELSPEIAQVVARSLQKRPEARYQTGRQFADDLRWAAASMARAPELPDEALVYDGARDAGGPDRMDFQETVMELPAVRNSVLPPSSDAR